MLQCQQDYALWTAATDTEQSRDALAAKYRSNLEALWEQLAADLRLIARGWIRSNMAPDTESLALNMFANIVFNLPKLRPDPQRNVRNLLVTVARRGLIDEYRRSYASSPRRQPKSAEQQTAPASGSDEARMWHVTGANQNGVAPGDSQPEPVDPGSYNIEDRMATRIDQQALLQVVWEYWPRNLSATDFQIMKLRWQSDPPSSFRDIAEQIGAGWEEDAVRQRHHRIMNATRKYLREQGLIDDTSVF